MMSKKFPGAFLFITILIIQMIVVKSQDVNPTPTENMSVSPYPPTETNQPISLTTHVIKVGYMEYGFSRNNFTANKGNVLYFEWEGDLEHSVVESTPETPCVKKEGGMFKNHLLLSL